MAPHMPVTDQPDGGVAVVNTRAINTTSPITGGGDLSADRTIALAAGGVQLSHLANLATARLLGRVTSGTGVPEAMTGTQATTLLDAFTSGLKGLAPASGGGTTNFLRADGTWTTTGSAAATTVDLTAAPYSVVAGSSLQAVARANSTAINQAISDYSGLKARLLLPRGDVYVDQGNGTDNWCIKFPSGTTDVSLVGHGMFATRIIQHGVGDSGSTHTIMIDGAQRIEVSDLGVQQGAIDNPDSGQQNHLVSVLQSAASPITRDIFLHHIFFGKALGDQFRILGASATIVNVKLLDFIANGDGVVNVASGRVGARSGIAMQRGWTQVEIGNGYICGTQNQPIDFEPSATGEMSYGYFHDLCADNSDAYSSGSSSVAAAIGGASSTTLSHSRFERIYCIEGRCKIFQTANCTFRDLQVITTTAWRSAPDVGTPNLDIDGGHTDLVLDNLYLSRSGAASAGELLHIDEGATRVSILGGNFIQGTAEYPIHIDYVTDLRIDGPTIQYDGASPSARIGLIVKAVAGDTSNPRIENVLVKSSTGKLRSAVEIIARTPRVMTNVRVSNVNSAGSALVGVWYSYGSGSTPDVTPIMYGIDNGSDPLWFQGDQGDTPITTVFPSIGGNPNDVEHFVGDATPVNAVAARQGSTCVLKNGDSTVRYFKKSASTGQIVCIAKASHVDGETVTISDGRGLTKVYEFDVNGTGVTAGRVQVNISGDTTATQVAARLETAIEANQPTIAATNGAGTLALAAITGTAIELSMSDTVTDGGFSTSSTTGWQVEGGVVATGQIVCATKANLVDTETLTIGDGVNPPVVYEFDVAGDGVTAGRVQVNVSTDTTATEVAARLETAIEANQPLLNVVNTTGTLAITQKLAGTFANITITDTVAHASFTVSGMSGGVNPAR